MKSLLVLAAFVCAVVAVEVRIRYQAPVLSLSLARAALNEKDVSVVFHYVIKNVAYQGIGEKSLDGWQFITHELQLDGADDIVAYAEIQDGEGHLIHRTQRSLLKLEEDGHIRAARLAPRRIRGAVVMRDDFNSLNLGNWKYEVSMYGGYNGEFQVYTNDGQNVFTKNGNLHIQPTLTVNDPRFDENFLHNGKMDMNALFGTCTESANYGCVREGKYGILPPVMSGKLKSNPGIRYGTVEIRARIPRGDWLWPAIWMLPKYNKYGTWPRSGEIDIMESRGNSGGNLGVGSVSSTLHWGPAYDQNRFQMTTGSRHTGSWADNFHTWKLEWTPTHIVTSVDGQQIMYVDPGSSFWNKGGFGGNNIWSGGEKMAPFDQEFYMILNVAVGGTSGFFPDNVSYNGVNKPWKNGSPHAAADFWSAHNQWQYTWQGDKSAMLIDYIEMRSWY